MTGNSVVITGRVKRDASARVIRDGLSVLNFTLMVYEGNERWAYVDCSAYADACDQLEGYVEADEQVTVHGHLSFRTYTDGGGRKRTGIVVMVERTEA